MSDPLRGVRISCTKRTRSRSVHLECGCLSATRVGPGGGEAEGRPGGEAGPEEAEVPPYSGAGVEFTRSFG